MDVGGFISSTDMVKTGHRRKADTCSHLHLQEVLSFFLPWLDDSGVKIDVVDRDVGRSARFQSLKERFRVRTFAKYFQKRSQFGNAHVPRFRPHSLIEGYGLEARLRESRA